MSEFAEIELTKTCNLNCKYCYEKDYLTDYSPSAIISFEKAKELILQYKNTRHPKNTSIELFGGEPLLAKEVIKQILKDPELNDNISYNLITNSTIFDEELANIMIDSKNFGSIEFSIDAPRIHDEYRVWRKNNGKSFNHCFEIFLKYKKLFDEKNRKIYRIRTTFVDKNTLLDVLSFSYYLNALGISVFINNAATTEDDRNIYSTVIKKNLTVMQMNNLKSNYLYEDDNLPKICPISCGSCKYSQCQASLAVNDETNIIEKRYNFGVFDDEIKEVSFNNTGDRFNNA